MPERVYQAFIDPDEFAQWIHPTGFSAEVHHFEPEEGRSYRISMTGETERMEEYGHAYTGTFEELVPGERIVQTERPEADEGGRSGEMTVTITFGEVSDGTDVTVRIEIPAAWPDEAIRGWKDALGNLVGCWRVRNRLGAQRNGLDLRPLARVSGKPARVLRIKWI